MTANTLLTVVITNIKLISSLLTPHTLDSCAGAFHLIRSYASRDDAPSTAGGNEVRAFDSHSQGVESTGECETFASKHQQAGAPFEILQHFRALSANAWLAPSKASAASALTQINALLMIKYLAQR